MLSLFCSGETGQRTPLFTGDLTAEEQGPDDLDGLRIVEERAEWFLQFHLRLPDEALFCSSFFLLSDPHVNRGFTSFIYFSITSLADFNPSLDPFFRATKEKDLGLPLDVDVLSLPEPCVVSSMLLLLFCSSAVSFPG